jgi:hypothetical protein
VHKYWTKMSRNFDGVKSQESRVKSQESRVYF